MVRALSISAAFPLKRRRLLTLVRALKLDGWQLPLKPPGPLLGLAGHSMKCTGFLTLAGLEPVGLKALELSQASSLSLVL